MTNQKKAQNKQSFFRSDSPLGTIGSCNKTDEELVGLVLQDPDSYLFLMERYETKLSFYIKHLTGLPDDDIEDILQDVFIKAYRNINGFDTKLKFSSWIYRIAHNEAVSHFRKARARPQTISSKESELFFQILGSKQNLAKEIEKKDQAAQIRKALETINKKYRDVLVLKFLEEKDYQEMSDILQKPMGTIATLINRAKKEFRKVADRQGLNLK